jgi:hypothetical protein
MRKINDFLAGPVVSTTIWLIIPYFINGFKAPEAGVSAIDAKGIINDCPARSIGSFL